MPFVVVSRPLHGPFAVPGAEVRIGAKGGQRSRADGLAYGAGGAAVVGWVTARVDDALRGAPGARSARAPA